MLSPGFVYGLARYFNGSDGNLLTALTCLFWFIPFTIWKVGQAAFVDNENAFEVNGEAKRYKYLFIFIMIIIIQNGIHNYFLTFINNQLFSEDAIVYRNSNFLFLLPIISKVGYFS